jgi:Na+-translocating ferredoxin:NAD+ oxidoreductase RnfD subunit
VLCCAGTFLNARFTKKIPLIAAWLGAFALQAALRSLYFHTPLAAPLGPMTGVAFLLFTFYMVSDPATSPEAPRRQVLFGVAVAAAYAVLQLTHVVFGLFFALFAVCIARGAVLWATARRPAARAGSPVPGVLVAEAAPR